MFVSEVLIGEPVGLVLHDDRLWMVRLGHLEIGRLDGYALRIIKTPVRAYPCIRASVTHVFGRTGTASSLRRTHVFGLLSPISSVCTE